MNNSKDKKGHKERNEIKKRTEQSDTHDNEKSDALQKE